MNRGTYVPLPAWRLHGAMVRRLALGVCVRRMVLSEGGSKMEIEIESGVASVDICGD